MTDKPFQRVGSVSNAHVGREFEDIARAFFVNQRIDLVKDFKLEIGVSGKQKIRKFDLGSNNPPIIVECKSHRFTAGNKIPSAKITVWNESMYFFHIAPREFRKIMFVLRDVSKNRNETLAEYYVRTYYHLIPDDVEILEYDLDNKNCRKIS